MKKALISTMLITSMTAHASDDQCNQLVALERDMGKKLPVQIDEVTTVVELSVNCTTRVVKFVKHLSISGDELEEGFKERKQRQYVNLQCNRQGLATKGWASTDYIYDKNLVLLMNLKATPAMCHNS